MIGIDLPFPLALIKHIQQAQPEQMTQTINTATTAEAINQDISTISTQTEKSSDEVSNQASLVAIEEELTHGRQD